MDLFIFGTLLHMPLLAEVSGIDDVADHVSAARYVDHGVSRVAGQVFPMIHAAPGQVAEGVIVSGLDETALARLDYYETAFGYDRVAFEVTDAAGDLRSVTAYVPQEGRWSPAEPWDKGAWIAERGALTVATARVAMAGMADQPPEAMGAQYPSIMSRAASAMRAAGEARGADLGREDVIVSDLRRPYLGFFNVEEMDMRYRQYDGSMSDEVNRAVFLGVDCAIVLPYDPVRDRVLLIEQFRPGAYARGDAHPWTLEPIAGRIDGGETPEQSALREAEEEAGLTLRALHQVGAAYPSPGTTSEFFYVYVGICDLPDEAAGLGGEVSEHEDIRSEVLDWATFDARLMAGEYRLMPMLVTGHWLARNRDRLRSEA